MPLSGRILYTLNAAAVLNFITASYDYSYNSIVSKIILDLKIFSTQSALFVFLNALFLYYVTVLFAYF